MGQRPGGGVVVVVRRFIAILALTTPFWGCAAEPPQEILTPIEVKVPVAIPVYCQAAKLDKPELPISALRAASAPADAIRAYAATVAILKGAVQQRDLVIDGCAEPARDRQRLPAPDDARSGAADEAVK